MNAIRHKPRRTYPTVVDAWSTILGAYFFLIGAAGALFMATHAHGSPVTYPIVLVVLTFGFVGVSILLINLAMSRYISQVYNVSEWEQSLSGGGLYFRRGMPVFNSANLTARASLVGLRPEFVIMSLRVLIAVDGGALVIGLLTH